MLIQATGRTTFSHTDPFWPMKGREAAFAAWLITVMPLDILITEGQCHLELRAQIYTSTGKISS